jgi:hypothetical protein
MSKIEEKKPVVATPQQPPQTLPASAIDCSQAEKRLWLVKVNLNEIFVEINTIFYQKQKGAKVFGR